MRQRWAILTCCLICALSAQAQRMGRVCVHNSTSKSIYVVVNGRDQGDVADSSYMEYPVPFGDVKVEAYKGYTTNDPYAKKWTAVSAQYPGADVEFTDYDF